MASAANSLARRAPALVSCAIAAFFAVPFGYLAVRALGDPGDAWSAAIDEATLAPLWRSVQVTVLCTLVATVVGVGLAWLTTRTDLPGRRLLRVVAVLPLVIPSFVAAYTYVSTFAPGGLAETAFGITGLPEVRGLGGAVFVLTVVSYPYVMLPVAARLSALPPSLEESARLLGRSSWRTFATLVLPQCAASITAGALLVSLYCLSDFGAVQFVRFDTLTRRIFAARFDPVTSVSVSLLLGLLALAIATGERFASRRQGAFAGAGARQPVVYRLGRIRWPALGAVSAAVGITLVIPMSVMAWWVIRGVTSGGRRSRAVDLPDASWSSAWIGVVSALITVIVVTPLAWFTVRRRGRLAESVGILVTTTFALPGIVIALALVRIGISTPFYQGFVLLIAAYVLHFGGLALGAAQSAVATVPTRYDEAARLLGAGRLRRLWRVDLPLMAPGLAAGGGLVLLSVMKELPATLMLRPLGFDTLATRISFTVEDALLIDAGQLSLVLVAISALLTWLLVLRRQPRAA